MWTISIIVLFIVGLNFIKDYKSTENKYFFWISMFFFLFIIARILRLIVRFYIGEPPPGEPLTGTAFILESIYTIISFIGLSQVYYALESTIIKKTHYAFTILVWVTCAISIIDFITRSLLYITIPFFIATVLGLPLIFLGLAINSSGSVRKNALLVAFGVVLFVLSIAMDIPDGRVIFGTLPDLILATVPPGLAIISCVILRRGFQAKM